MFPWIFSVINVDHGRHQNVVRTSVTHSAVPNVPCFSNHILRHLWFITEQKHRNMQLSCQLEQDSLLIWHRHMLYMGPIQIAFLSCSLNILQYFGKFLSLEFEIPLRKMLYKITINRNMSSILFCFCVLG